MAFAEKLTLAAHEVRQIEVDSLLSQALTDADVVDAVLVVANMSLRGTLAQGLGMQFDGQTLGSLKGALGQETYQTILAVVADSGRGE